MTAAAPRLAVIGLGLIGGSVALRAVAQGLEVRAWDPDPQTCAQASGAGITCVSSAPEAVTGADLVILCGPLVTLAHTAGEIAPYLSKTATVTDVGSVKASVRSDLARAGITSQYVGAHPMAGTEAAGFAAASPDLLVGATWGLTIEDSTELSRTLAVIDFLTSVFGARILALSDHNHDGAVALISHVPHVLAHGLLGLAATSEHAIAAQCLAAGSFRDGTRVARLNPARNQAMVHQNRHEVVSALKTLMGDLEQLTADLQAGNPADWFFDRCHLWPQEAADGLGGSDQLVQAVPIDQQTWRAQLLGLGARGAQLVGLEDIDGSVMVNYLERSTI